MKINNILANKRKAIQKKMKGLIAYQAKKNNHLVKVDHFTEKKSK